MHRKPEVPEERVPVVECLDGHARITSKKLAPTHFVKGGTLQNACSTRPRVVVRFVRKVLIMHIARLKNSVAKGSKRMVTKSAVALLKSTRQLGSVWSRRSVHFLRKSSNIRKPVLCVQFTKAVVRHADIREQNPSLGMICPGDPHQRNPNAPKFEVRSQEETEWQEGCAP